MEHYDLQTSPPVLLLRKKCVELTIALKTVKAFKKIQGALQCRMQAFILSSILKARFFLLKYRLVLKYTRRQIGIFTEKNSSSLFPLPKKKKCAMLKEECSN